MADAPGDGAEDAPGGMPDAPPAASRAGPQRPAPRVLEALVCPLTGARLAFDAERMELVSKPANLAYPIRSGIPIMLVDEARKLVE